MLTKLEQHFLCGCATQSFLLSTMDDAMDVVYTSGTLPSHDLGPFTPLPPIEKHLLLLLSHELNKFNKTRATKVWF